MVLVYKGKGDRNNVGIFRELVCIVGKMFVFWLGASSD